MKFLSYSYKANKNLVTDFFQLNGGIKYVFIILTMIFGFIVRIEGIDFGLPQLFHPDEPFLIDPAYHIMQSGDLNPHFFDYPSLLIYIYSAIFKIESILWGTLNNTQQYLTGRVTVALLGTLTIFLVYLVGKKLYNEKIGIMASLLFAFMPLAVQNSHYATVDVPVTFFVTLAFLSLIYTAHHGTMRSYIISGTLIGLAASTKYYGGLLVVTLFVAFLCNIYKKSHTKAINYIDEIKKFLLAGIVSVVAFILTTPYSLLDFGEFYSTLRYEFNLSMNTGDAVYYDNKIPGYIFHLLTSLNEGLTPFLEIISIMGIILIMCKLIIRDRDEKPISGLLLLSWILPYYLLIGLAEVRYARYTLPLFPFLAVSASYFIFKASQFVSIKLGKNSAIKKNILFGLIAVILIGPILFNTLQGSLAVDNEFLQVDTRSLSLHWIDQNIPAGSTVIIGLFTPQVDQLSKYNVEKYGWDNRLQNINASDMAQANYIITSSIDYWPYFSHPDTSQKQIAFYNSLDRNLKLLKRFDPNDTVTGPTIKIYYNNKTNT